MSAPAPATTPAPTRRVSWRVGLIALAGACLLVGLDAALLLVGVPAPVGGSHLEGAHGMVMVLGFMGALIALERAQSLRRGWAYLAPAVLAVGGLALVAGTPVLGKLLLVEGCLLFLAVYIGLWRRAPLALVAVQALAVVLAAAAATLWLVVDIAAIVPLLAGFLVLTIAAERAEMAQLAMGDRAIATLVTLACAVSASALLTLTMPPIATRMFGASVLAVAAWLIRDDVARRTIRHTAGLRRFNGAALLAGYSWLGIAGITWLVVGQPLNQPGYDTVIHATFLGFGVSMIMAHAPIIFPAVIGRPLPYRPVAWLPLGVLHLGLAARVASNLMGATAVWQVSSVVTVVAVLLFLLTTVYAVGTA